jgi:hypothetical protein
LAPSTAISRSLGLCLGLAAAGGLAAGLAATNPGPAAFEEFAAERLSSEVGARLCTTDALPVLLHDLLRDCTALVRSQGPLLGRMARDHSHRLNLGLLSIYHTEVGGQALVGSWRLPRYRVLTLAAAGQFVLLESGEVVGGGLLAGGGP